VTGYLCNLNIYTIKHYSRPPESQRLYLLYVAYQPTLKTVWQQLLTLTGFTIVILLVLLQLGRSKNFQATIICENNLRICLRFDKTGSREGIERLNTHFLRKIYILYPPGNTGIVLDSF